MKLRWCTSLACCFGKIMVLSVIRHFVFFFKILGLLFVFYLRNTWEIKLCFLKTGKKIETWFLFLNFLFSLTLCYISVIGSILLEGSEKTGQIVSHILSILLVLTAAFYFRVWCCWLSPQNTKIFSNLCVLIILRSFCFSLVFKRSGLCFTSILFFPCGCVFLGLEQIDMLFLQNIVAPGIGK